MGGGGEATAASGGRGLQHVIVGCALQSNHNRAAVCRGGHRNALVRHRGRLRRQ